MAGKLSRVQTQGCEMRAKIARRTSLRKQHSVFSSSSRKTFMRKITLIVVTTTTSATHSRQPSKTHLARQKAALSTWVQSLQKKKLSFPPIFSKRKKTRQHCRNAHRLCSKILLKLSN